MHTISIIDDDAFVRDSIGDLVSSLGYKVLTFDSARQFLTSGEIQHTSCVIADVQMPELNGLELQRQMIGDGYATPIIFVTAYPKESARAQAFANGAVAFLIKPFEEQALLGSINAALMKAANLKGQEVS
jgi:FixJ family two-component response regulator